MENMKKIKKNAARCKKCGDVIESRHVHDFVTCKCGAISVDGGHYYLKRCAMDLNDIVELSEYEEDAPSNGDREK